MYSRTLSAIYIKLSDFKLPDFILNTKLNILPWNFKYIPKLSFNSILGSVHRQFFSLLALAVGGFLCDQTNVLGLFSKTPVRVMLLRRWGQRGPSRQINIGCCGLVAKLCLTLMIPMGYSPPGSSVHWISQTKILEWLPFPSPGDLPDPGIEPGSPALQADSLLTELRGKPQGWE